MNTEKFWQWFVDNSEALTMQDDLDPKEKEQLLEELQHQLEDYCQGLTYEIGEPTPTGRTFTVSAEGDTDLFRYVVELIDNAPDVDWWTMVAFRQPQGKDLRVVFDKFRFETKKMYFMQLENEVEPDILGVRVALPDPVDDDEDQLVGVYVTLEALIGEFDCATLVGYIETGAIPEQPELEGYMPMDDFPKFVEWFKRKRDQ
ncbi:MAG: hypothetical protein IJV22_05015 [Bacteroidales bacterium]|nr:hypothetical protein [Bacteroidales bacterium]